MLLNSNVTLETKLNSFGEVEVNGISRRNLINNNLSGMHRIINFRSYIL